jgi:transposase-like protein
MRWPLHAIETVRPSRFMPPFCPRPTCVAHRGTGRGFKRNGWYRKPSDPKKIPRFLCRDCGKSCSRQTFSTTYYLKRPALLISVASGLAACSAHRQIARSNHCSKTSVTRMAERLGRHAILFHARCRKELPALSETLVHDHWEVFVGRQDQALGIGTAVGSQSWFVYDLDPAPHRGIGRRPDRKSETEKTSRSSRPYVRSIKRTFQGLIPHLSVGATLTCNVDGRVDYRVAVRESGLEGRVILKSYPNPERGPKGSPRSPEAIERDHAMFLVDQLHQLLRHSCSDHKRETIAFGRRLESILGRAHLLAVWKNFIKSRSERRPDRTTPAMRLGLTDSRWRFERLLCRRLFPEREGMAEHASKIYRKSWTRGLPGLTLKHAA